MKALMVSVFVMLGSARTAAADAVLVGRVTDLLGRPLIGARVHVLAVGSEEQIAVTDGHGNYRVVVGGNREIQVVVGSGDRNAVRRRAIADGATERLDLQIEIGEGEVIRIIDRKVVPPKAHSSARKRLPYSDAAIARDAWSRAWMLLDVSETGSVLRVKLIKRPGFDLDAIAVREAMKLTFDPALDENGKPMRTQILWGLEWPAHGWVAELDWLTAMQVGRSYAALSLGLPPGHSPAGTLRRVPCAGSGEPLDLDSFYPTYRDCSVPNLAKLPYLPWLDGTQPIPPEPPQFVAPPEAPLHLTKASYVPQIAASTVTASLIGTWVVTYVKYRKYLDRLTAVSAGDGMIFVGSEERQHNRDAFLRWQRLTVVTALAAIASAGVTTSLWFRHQRKADFSVQPENNGASVSIGGRF